LIQEHWKSSHDLDEILNFSENYNGFGISAMDTALKRGVLVGRPYGGCAILVNNSLSHFTKLLFASDRFVLVSIGSLIVINVYMPNYSTQVNNVCDTMLNEISAIINNHPNSLCIFGGDMNCNLHNKSNISSLINTFMSEHDLIFADHNLVNDNIMTYNHPTMDHC